MCLAQTLWHKINITFLTGRHMSADFDKALWGWQSTMSPRKEFILYLFYYNKCPFSKTHFNVIWSPKHGVGHSKLSPANWQFRLLEINMRYNNKTSRLWYCYWLEWGIFKTIFKNKASHRNSYYHVSIVYMNAAESLALFELVRCWITNELLPNLKSPVHDINGEENW